MGNGDVVRIWTTALEAEQVTVALSFEYKGAPSIDSMPKLEVSYLSAGRAAESLKAEHISSTSFVQGAGPKRMHDVRFRCVHKRLYLGKYLVKVEWQSVATGAHMRHTLELPAGQVLNEPETLFVDTGVARMCKLLQEPLTEEEQLVSDAALLAADTDAAKVGLVLIALFRGLQRGLGYLWKRGGPQCCHTDGTPLRDVPVSALNSPSAIEESWAQHFTELVLGAPYAGGGMTMGAPEAENLGSGVDSGHKRDAWVFQQYARSDTPLYPQMFACQQLATMGLLSRGYDSLASNPLDSHGAHVGELPGKVLWSNNGANKLSGDNWMSGQSISGEQAFDKELLAPGTCFYYYRESTHFPHVAVLLRGVKTSKEFQLIDTGGWIANDGAFLGVNSGLAFDTKTVANLVPSSAKVTGILVPPKGQDLKAAIEKIRGAHPMGALQVVIARGASVSAGSILWASKLLPMSQGAHRFPISRLMASLRGLPFLDELTVIWRVYVPGNKEGALAIAARANAWWTEPAVRAKPLVELGLKQGLPCVNQRTKQNEALKAFVPVTLPVKSNVAWPVALTPVAPTGAGDSQFDADARGTFEYFGI